MATEARILTSVEVIARLRAIRKVRGLTVQAIADKTGIPRVVLAKLECGRREMFNLDEARLICEALGVDLRTVISDDPMPIATAVHVV